MALINGNDYDHIDFTKNGVTTRHMLKDTLSRQMSGDLVKVQNEEPTSEGTKIWIKPSGDSEVQVPTYEEFEELSDKIDDADATIESLAVGAQPTVSVTEVDSHKRFSFGIPASNGIASITKTATDGVIDTYTIAMTDGTSTSFSVNNSDITPESMAEAIATALQDYARIDGYYPDMTVGNAEQLNSSKFVENSEPYTLRTSGGSSDIGNREYLDAVVGGTVAWNQMVRDEASENSTDFADVVTVTDAVEDAAGVKVQIEPVQDLHGYDHPWPAGGGKNLLHVDSRVSATVAGVTYTSDDDYIYLNGTKYGQGYVALNRLSISLEPGTYYARAFAVGGTSTNQIYIYANNGNADFGGDLLSAERTYTIAETTTVIFRFLISVDGNVFSNYKIGIVISKTSGVDVFYPYSNICPITGWDGVKVTRTGKNLCDESNLLLAEGWTVTDGVYSGINTALHIAFSNGFPGMAFKPDTTYTVSLVFRSTTASKITVIGFNYTDGTHSELYVQDTVEHTVSFTSTSGKSVSNLLLSYGSGDKVYISQMQVEEGSTATAYEPYAGNTYDITLPTEAGTVYGGELTVNAGGSGSLVVDRKVIVFDGSDNYAWSYLPNYHCMICGNEISDIEYGIAIVDYQNSYGIIVHRTSMNAKQLQFGTSQKPIESVASSVEEWKSKLNENPIQVVYPLAVPVAYTLSPTEIRTLLGQNHIWSDAGQTALTYTGTDEHLVLESGKKYLSRISGTDSMLLGSGQEITAAKGTDNVFDLTQMFGSAVADYVYGQGAGFFRKWFGDSHYPYNAGELLSVEGLQSHDMVGFNQWDEEWESGSYSSTGQKVSTAAGRIRSANKIRVLPSTTYYMTKGVNILCQYDSNGDFVSFAQLGVDSASNVAHSVTMGENTHFITFASYAYYGNTYKHDICISLAHNNSRNGEYAPYEKHSYPLDSSVILRGIPKVGASGVYWDGDRYLPDGTVERRYGVVDMGTLDWAKYGSTFYANVAGLKPTGSSLTKGNIMCPKYTNVAVYQVIGTYPIDKVIAANEAQGRVNAYDSIYAESTASEFKDSLSGVYLVYELATPTIETAQPYHSMQWVSDWGTEEFASTGIVPVGSETRYPANLRDKLQHLPDAASGNGSYLITQTDGQMVLTPFPAPPSTAGNYVLKATVTGGVATYTWEVAT